MLTKNRKNHDEAYNLMEGLLNFNIQIFKNEYNMKIYNFYLKLTDFRISIYIPKELKFIKSNFLLQL